MRDKNTMKQSFVISMMAIQGGKASGGAAHVIVETTSSKTPSKKLSRNLLRGQDKEADQQLGPC
jgi:hypothetical protein